MKQASNERTVGVVELQLLQMTVELLFCTIINLPLLPSTATAALLSLAEEKHQRRRRKKAKALSLHCKGKQILIKSAKAFNKNQIRVAQLLHPAAA